MTARTVPLAFLLAALAAGLPAPCEWPAGPAVDLAIADGSGEQVIPLVGSTADGGIYVAWFDNSAGGYRVRLQRLDAAGVEQWPHNGIVVSAHPQDTALFGWDMIVDSASNAVLVFSDVRDGGDLDVHAYRIDAAGQFLWGPDGVTLSDNPDFEPAPRVAEASDGDFVFVWQRAPSSGDGDVRMQRLGPDGTPRLAPGGLAVVAVPGEDPGFVDVVPSTGGDVILSWVRDIGTFASPRHVHARRFSPAGAPVWPATVVVFDAFSVPIAHFPGLEPDGAGGAIVFWHRSDGSFFNAFVQHLDADGSAGFPHNGVALSTTAGMHHLDPSVAYDRESKSILAFWNERVSNQSQWGIFGQRISSAGTREWGAGGLELLPVSTIYKSAPRCLGYEGGAMVVLLDRPSGTDRLIAMRLDQDGQLLWPGSPVVLSSAASGKARYPVTMDARGIVRVAWEDNRNGPADVYAKSVNRDGTLGVHPNPGRVAGLTVEPSAASPGNLTLRWPPSCSPGTVGYAIYEGELRDFASHVALDCENGGGDLAEDVTPSGGDRYYLVVPLGLDSEGSYGTDSTGAERPPAAGPRCLDDQSALPCPP